MVRADLTQLLEELDWHEREISGSGVVEDEWKQGIINLLLVQYGAPASNGVRLSMKVSGLLRRSIPSDNFTTFLGMPTLGLLGKRGVSAPMMASDSVDVQEEAMSDEPADVAPQPGQASPASAPTLAAEGLLSQMLQAQLQTLCEMGEINKNIVRSLDYKRVPLGAEDEAGPSASRVPEGKSSCKIDVDSKAGLGSSKRRQGSKRNTVPVQDAEQLSLSSAPPPLSKGESSLLSVRDQQGSQFSHAQQQPE